METAFVNSKGKILKRLNYSKISGKEDHLIAIELDGNPYIPLLDVQGSVAALVDISRKASYITYKAFGQESIEEGAVITPWRYQA